MSSQDLLKWVEYTLEGKIYKYPIIIKDVIQYIKSRVSDNEQARELFHDLNHKIARLSDNLKPNEPDTYTVYVITEKFNNCWQ